MADPTKYHLCISAGPSYDTATHQLVPVNTSEPVTIESSEVSAKLHVRIQNYRGLPTNSHKSSPYFSDEKHKSDLYSISFTFTPKHDINGDALIFGNDFDRPIKDNLPYGFGAALRIVRWSIDPGLDGDVYADKPYLYGPLLSSINTLWIGNKEGEETTQPTSDRSRFDDSDNDESIDEQDQSILEASQTHPSDIASEGGTDPSGLAIRDDHAIPSTSAARMRHFLTQSHRQSFAFEAGRSYTCDFFNPYLDFNDLSLRLPGITLPLMRFWDGQPLRYTLKVRGDGGSDGADCSKGGRVALCVLIQLIPDEEVSAVEQKWKAHKPAVAAAAGHETSNSGGVPSGRRPDLAGVGGGGGGAGGRTEQSQDQAPAQAQTDEDDVD